MKTCILSTVFVGLLLNSTHVLAQTEYIVMTQISEQEKLNEENMKNSLLVSAKQLSTQDSYIQTATKIKTALGALSHMAPGKGSIFYQLIGAKEIYLHPQTPLLFINDQATVKDMTIVLNKDFSMTLSNVNKDQCIVLMNVFNKNSSTNKMILNNKPISKEYSPICLDINTINMK